MAKHPVRNLRLYRHINQNKKWDPLFDIDTSHFHNKRFVTSMLIAALKVYLTLLSYFHNEQLSFHSSVFSRINHAAHKNSD